MSLILVILLVLLVVGGLPQAGFHEYGYAPSGVGLVLLIVLLLILFGGFPVR